MTPSSVGPTSDPLVIVTKGAVVGSCLWPSSYVGPRATCVDVVSREGHSLSAMLGACVGGGGWLRMTRPSL
jgi:hypothetical protein